MGRGAMSVPAKGEVSRKTGEELPFSFKPALSG
jgi:hypothetical protein